MINKVTKKDAVNMVGQIVAGIFSNPANAHMLLNQHDRQQIIQQTIKDVQEGFMSSGICIQKDDEN